MIETPAMRRSALLAKMLEQQRQPTEIKGGYGELGARLLAQGITQWGANRADKAARAEREAANAKRRNELLASLPRDGAPASPQGAALAEALVPSPVAPVINNTQVPQEADIAPIAPVAGSSMPPAAPSGVVAPPVPMADVPPIPQAPASVPPVPQAPPPANPRGPTPEEIALIREAANSGDPGQMAWADQTWQEIRMRMATRPETNIQIAPDGTPYNTNDPEVLSRRFRNVENINGFLTDTNDPNNVGRYMPDLQPGEEPLYDQNGNVVGVRNLAGAIEALGARERTSADAANASRASYAGVEAGNVAAAQAPYQVERVILPDGSTAAISRSELLSGGGVRGQSPADAIRAEGQARQQVETGNVVAQRGRDAPERVRRYEEALALIPKAITGFNADARLATARALAATGNQDARDAVAATEIYQNLIGRDIGAIVRDMVGAANISNSDRELATRIAGGDTNITPQALTRIVNYELSRQTGYLAASGRPLSEAQARRLPRGTEFIGEDGQRYRVP
jgi:hypothetical protein